MNALFIMMDSRKALNLFFMIISFNKIKLYHLINLICLLPSNIGVYFETRSIRKYDIKSVKIHAIVL